MFGRDNGLQERRRRVRDAEVMVYDSLFPFHWHAFGKANCCRSSHASQRDQSERDVHASPVCCVTAVCSLSLQQRLSRMVFSPEQSSIGNRRWGAIFTIASARRGRLSPFSSSKAKESYFEDQVVRIVACVLYTSVNWVSRSKHAGMHQLTRMVPRVDKRLRQATTHLDHLAV